MRGTRTLSFICVLAAAAPLGAETRAIKVQGANAVSLLPGQVHWTAQDRAAVDRAKVIDFSMDKGDAGWSFDFLSLRSPRLGEDACCAAARHFHGAQAGMEAWHALGGGDAIRLRADMGKASRRALSAVALPARSRAAYADAHVTWDHGERLAISTGWYRQGGWGRRRMDLDVTRLGNGEAAAASGLRAAVQLAVGGSGRSARSWMMLEVREGSRAACLGTCSGGTMRHASEAGLTFNSSF